MCVLCQLSYNTFCASFLLVMFIKGKLPEYLSSYVTRPSESSDPNSN